MRPISSRSISSAKCRSRLEKLRDFLLTADGRGLTAKLKPDAPQHPLHRPVGPSQETPTAALHVVQKDAPVQALGDAASKLYAQRSRHSALRPKADHVAPVEELKGPAPLLGGAPQPLLDIAGGIRTLLHRDRCGRR